MSLYASVVANRIDEAMYTKDGTLFIQKHIPTQYYTRKHKHGLWPLEVLQHQVPSPLPIPPIFPLTPIVSLPSDQREVSRLRILGTDSESEPRLSELVFVHCTELQRVPRDYRFHYERCPRGEEEATLCQQLHPD
jgi:hypothetical protein